MKRYLLFKGEYYYAMGGMDDFVNDFDDLDEAIKSIPSTFDPKNQWAHIFDLETRTEVWTGQELKG